MWNGNFKSTGCPQAKLRAQERVSHSQSREMLCDGICRNTNCSRRREEAEIVATQECPPRYLGGYEQWLHREGRRQC